MTLTKASRSPVRPKNNFLVFGQPLIENEDIREVTATLRSGWVGAGPQVRRFEEMFRHYKGSRHTVGLNSCTAAIHLSLLAAGIAPGDEVISTPMTFCATINAIIHSGARPVLADCEPDSMNISPAEIESKVTPKTRAILIVHFAGRPCDMDAVMTIARKRRLSVIEDCAHAIEAEFHGKKSGTFGDTGCFSFYATKSIVTGDGGMAVTDNEEWARKIRTLSLQGMDKDAWKRFDGEGGDHYQVVECGYKYNMTDIMAALAIPQLKRLEERWKRRAEIWQRYQEAFADIPIATPKPPDPDTRHAYHLYPVLIDERTSGLTRDEFRAAMARENIGVGVHYRSAPEHPLYQKKLGWKPQDYPNACRIGRQTVSLPLSARLTDEDAADVIQAVRKIIKSRGDC
ncbi:MAG: DegT/DnrJ/EryC1/StrS family aminotransferase [Candidatus Omnitrophota bacterium]|nr:DegT/DnrJ/EryC1/StrS family aminotransferase [Candidatus Omnitrophota bacterium]MDZ4241787.1 DegT/DnrJ/EryC1/StrS family aminotransferase [Candidatus Omnitrophota bacterium]